MAKGATISWRGKIKPKLGKCPACGKKGLGREIFVGTTKTWIRKCRYCQHTERDVYGPLGKPWTAD